MFFHNRFNFDLKENMMSRRKTIIRELFPELSKMNQEVAAGQRPEFMLIDARNIFCSRDQAAGNYVVLKVIYNQQDK